MHAHERLEGHELVLARFGRWPGFHDGEVHRLVFDRTGAGPGGRRTPTLEFVLRGWNMTPEITAEGFHKLEADSLVHFVFEDVFDVELEGFNQQNVITRLDLSIVPLGNGKQDALRVELEPCYLFACGFKALRGRVQAVRPYAERDAAG